MNAGQTAENVGVVNAEQPAENVGVVNAEKTAEKVIVLAAATARVPTQAALTISKKANRGDVIKKREGKGMEEEVVVKEQKREGMEEETEGMGSLTLRLCHGRSLKTWWRRLPWAQLELN